MGPVPRRLAQLNRMEFHYFPSYIKEAIQYILLNHLQDLILLIFSLEAPVSASAVLDCIDSILQNDKK